MGRKKKQKRSLTRRQHRLVGASISLFLLFLVVTGVLINHSHDLGLDRQAISSPRILDWYGLSAPGEIRHFVARGHWVSHAGERWYLDGAPVAYGDLGMGAVALDDWILAAGKQSLLILDLNGTLIERIPWSGRDAGEIRRIGLSSEGLVVIESANGFWLGDAELLEWNPLEQVPLAATWSKAESPPQAIAQAITGHFRGPGISREQLLLDLHSGRIFGAYGVLIYDILALITGSLAVSGLVLWWRGRRNGMNVSSKRKKPRK